MLKKIAPGVTNYPTGTRTSKPQDSNPSAPTQPTWRQTTAVATADSAKNLWQHPEPLTRHARYYPFGEGHVQARSVLRLEQGTEQGQLPQHATEDL